MKKIFLTKPLILCLLFSLFMGIAIGRGLEKDYSLYVAYLVQLPFRYVFIPLIIVVSNLVFSFYFNPVILMRKHTFSNVFISMFINELVLYLFIIVTANIPALVLVGRDCTLNVNLMISVIINFLIIASVISCIIKIIDLYIKNRIISSCLFFLIFAILDFLIDHYIYYIFQDSVFGLNCIFALPGLYSNYYIIALGLLVFICLAMSILMNLVDRKDYFLRNEIK